MWSGTKPKIKLEILKCPKSKGGLGLVDLCAKHSALVVKNIQHLHSNKQLMDLTSYFCQTERLETISHGKKLFSDTNFWCNLFCKWLKITYHEPQSACTILRQSLEYNSMIRIDNDIIRWPKWYEAGMLTVEDIWDNCNEHFKMK